MIELEAEAPIKCWEEGRIDLDVMLLPDKDLDIVLTCVVQGVTQRSYPMAHLGSKSSLSVRQVDVQAGSYIIFSQAPHSRV